MRFYGGSVFAVGAIVLCASMRFTHDGMARRAVSGIEWDYRGSVTIVNTRDVSKTWHRDLHMTAMQTVNPGSRDEPILRFRTAVSTEKGRSAPEAPESAVWVQFPARYMGHLPTPHSLSYDMAMADELNVPRPFTKPLQVGQTRLVELPIFALLSIDCAVVAIQ